MSGVLTADDVADPHAYLASARPKWSRTMWSIRRDGGPWYCACCDAGSLLIYRCSRCGHELTGDARSTTADLSVG